MKHDIMTSQTCVTRREGDLNNKMVRIAKPLYFWEEYVGGGFSGSSTKICPYSGITSITPRKINVEPENTPLEEENNLPNHHMGVSKNTGTPKWMVYNGKPY